MDYKERLDMAVARQQAILTAMQPSMLKKVSKKLERVMNLSTFGRVTDLFISKEYRQIIEDAKESIDRELEWREERRIEEANFSSSFEY
tara:strand:+ start:2107 stop:2373 length:267 start_codon:yes stop_codon:yes gene_type:complete